MPAIHNNQLSIATNYRQQITREKKTTTTNSHDSLKKWREKKKQK